MTPRVPIPQPTNFPTSSPSAVTHAHVARRLLRRAVRHLKHAEKFERTWPSGDDSLLLRQALERLVVADLLIDAYTTPMLAGAGAEHEPETGEAM